MAVKMRLTRMGDKKSPFYRIVIADSRVARDGKCIDKVGHYNPIVNQGILPKPTKLSPAKTKVRKSSK